MKKVIYSLVGVIALFGVQSFAAGEAQMFKIGQLDFVAVLDASSNRGADILLNKNSPIAKEILSKNPNPPSSTNVYIVKDKNKIILIDTGNGGNRGDAVKNMKAAGISPSQVSAVLLTHMHGDHIGGLLDEKGAKIFANADIYVSQTETDFWLKNPSARAANADLAKQVVKTYGGKIKFLQWGKETVSGIKAIKAIGHTPGHTVFEISSNGEKILVVGDIVHLIEVQTADPSLSVAYDIDPEQAAKTRAEILKYASDNNIRIAGMHIPFSGVGKINKAKAPNRAFVFEADK
ncbi:MAG: MBL fold metallo-hydrolase [Elusimicrobiota bacterium]|nr:MBL fold metallo-hydrolase [Elusimicrobiota bacterium]